MKYIIKKDIVDAKKKVLKKGSVFYESGLGKGDDKSFYAIDEDQELWGTTLSYIKQNKQIFKKL